MIENFRILISKNCIGKGPALDEASESTAKLLIDKLQPCNLGKNYQIASDFFSKKSISSSSRRLLWSKMIGNGLNITQEQYSIYKDLIKSRKSNPYPIEKQLNIDLRRTLPFDKSLSESQKAFTALKRVLLAFYLYRPDIGYIQGMTYLVCSLYLHVDEFNTFKLFSNLIITRPLIHALYSFDSKRVLTISHIFDRMAKKQCP